MTSLVKIISTMTAVAILAGCGGAAPWKSVRPGNHKYPARLGFSIDVPDNWVTFTDRQSRTLLLTRHSVPMDVIMITKRPLPASLAHTNLTINEHMQIYEAAAIMVSNLRSSPGIVDFEVEDLAPHIVSGLDAFRIFGRYNLENGLSRRFLIYGFIHDNGKYFTEIGLHALENYYFDATVGDFVALVDSFCLRRGC